MKILCKLVLVTAMQANAVAIELPTELVDALTDTEHKLKSFAVESRIDRRYIVSNVGGRPENETTVDIYDQGNFFHESQMSMKLPDGSINTLRTEVAYDGNVFCFGNPRTEGSVVMRFLGENESDESADANKFNTLYLNAAGIFLPSSPAGWRKSTMRSLVLYLAEQGTISSVSSQEDNVVVELEVPDQAVLEANRVDLNAREKLYESGGVDTKVIERETASLRYLQSLEPVRKVRFVLDSTKEFAVLHRTETTPDGRPILKVECGGHQRQGESQIWLPKQCTVEQFASLSSPRQENEPVVTLDVALTAFSVNPPPNIKYSISYEEPGSRIVERSTREALASPDNQIVSTVGGDRESLQNSAKLASSNSSTRRLLFWGNLILFSTLAGYMILRSSFKATDVRA